MSRAKFKKNFSAARADAQKHQMLLCPCVILVGGMQASPQGCKRLILLRQVVRLRQARLAALPLPRL